MSTETAWCPFLAISTNTYQTWTKNPLTIAPLMYLIPNINRYSMANVTSCSPCLNSEQVGLTLRFKIPIYVDRDCMVVFKFP